ncbi:MAG: sulfatase-like hydrolase/transferase [Acidimicrobiales bacterium]
MRESPNLLLIVLDAVRSDVMGSTFVDTSRTLQAERCITSAPWTLPSCMAMLRGTPAWQIGPRAFWRPRRRQRRFMPIGRRARPDRTPRPPNLLLDRLGDGWRKAAYVNNPAIGRGSGAETGFDVWDYSTDYEEPFERAADEISNARRGQPVFLVLHSNMVHDFYRPDASRYATTMDPPLGPRVVQWRDLDAEEADAARATYRSCAAALESRMRATVDLARQRDDFIIAVTSDHGEGLEPDRARVHHGGRVHQDLIQVPLWFDLPSSISTVGRDRLADTLASTVVSSTEILPTLFETAGVAELGADVGFPPGRAKPRTLVSEDRRYLYLRDRFRLNWEGLMQNMTKADQARNQRMLEQLDQAIVLRSFLRFPDKLIVTSMTPKASTNGRSLPSAIRELCRQLSGTPVLLRHGDQILALQHYDLVKDPAEETNLLADNGWQSDLIGEPWIGDLTVLGPGAVERSLAEAIELGEQLSLT